MDTGSASGVHRKFRVGFSDEHVSLWPYSIRCHGDADGIHFGGAVGREYKPDVAVGLDGPASAKPDQFAGEWFGQ